MLERPEQFAAPVEMSEGRHPKPLLRRGLDYLLSFGWVFIATVVVPTTLALLYFGLFASDVYISESRFVVRSPDKRPTSGLGLLLKTAEFTSAGDEVFAAQEFVKSRDALMAVNKRNAFAQAYGNSSISWFDRYGTNANGSSFEDLYKYYKKRVTVEHESTSSVTTLTVRAYSPEAAHRFNAELLDLAEATVNRLNERGRSDLIRFAETEVMDAKRNAQNAALALSAYRNSEGIVDPEKQAAVQLQMISKLQDNLISAKGQLVQLRAFTPQNPQIPVLQKRIDELSREIDEQIGRVAGSRRSLSSAAAQFQRLSLENEFAGKQLASAMASLETARNEARRKQAYVERIVQPNMPDEALEPRRSRGILATFALGLVAWGVLSMLLAGLREHKD